MLLLQLLVSNVQTQSDIRGVSMEGVPKDKVNELSRSAFEELGCVKSSVYFAER